MDISLNDGETVLLDDLNRHIIELYTTFNDFDNENKEVKTGEEVRRLRFFYLF